MNTYIQIFASLIFVLVGYKPFRYCRLQWKIAVSTVMYYNTEAGIHRLKYMKLHERKEVMNKIETASKVAKMYLIFMVTIISVVAFGIYAVFNPIF